MNNSLKLDDEEFSADEACAATGLSKREFNFVRASIFSLNGFQENQFFETDQKYQWIIRPEAYFSYLQYLEFCHAIEYAKRAYWMAVFAVIVSLIGVFISKFL
ncbi:hypothetical protein ABXJ76_11870 [Methylobacter sp. G7]|uniref:hypothetical protein n=1 Tax=Methylobacter sp. G7 TaxID=3230117 RepID=UPI003D805812